MTSIRFWIGAALLAGSWLFALGYFYPANPWVASSLLAAAVLLLSTSNKPLAVSQKVDTVAVLLLLPAMYFAAWPYRIAPLLIGVGLVLRMIPIRRQPHWAYGVAAAATVAGLLQYLLPFLLKLPAPAEEGRFLHYGATLLLVLGLGTLVWLNRQSLGNGAVITGILLLVQSLVLELYAASTARSHDLPWPLPDMLAGLARLLGIDAVADGTTIAFHTMRQTHRLAATWELLLDPATLLFLASGVAMLFVVKGRSGTGKGETNAGVSLSVDGYWSTWLRAVRTLTLIVLCWLPVRAALLIAVYVHRVLRADPQQPLYVMNHFFSPWVLLGLLVVPVLLVQRFVPIGEQALECPSLKNSARENGRTNRPLLPLSVFRLLASSVFIAIGVAIWTAAIYWNPVGPRRSGRVMVVERHSEWEPTTKPYDTTWFAEPPLFGEASGYNYAAIYDYLGQYYRMSRLSEHDSIDERRLSHCDVLVIKIPTHRYAADEVNAIDRFVKKGGGLLLIGDHTNFSRSSTAMNDITRRMGFIFRDDLLFGFGESPYEEHYEKPRMAHPIVAHLPPMDFAVSCSIDPGSSHGRAAVVNAGLWNMGPEYHAENFHPVPQHCPEMRYGQFVQVWSAWHGDGRAVAFTDSTIFSNFCVFQPGKAEMMLGMVEWLNHANPWFDPRPWLLLLGVLPFGAAVALCHRKANVSRVALLFLAAGACGWGIGGVAVSAANCRATPTPQRVRPQQQVVIDRETSMVRLAEGMFPKGDDDGYGMLEAWIPRLGCHTIRKQGDELFAGDAILTICPTRPMSTDLQSRLTDYVKRGGKLLVIDAPDNVHSTAETLLKPFGLSISRDRCPRGRLSELGQSSAVNISSACEVIGGQPLAKVGMTPVAAGTPYGKGWVMAAGVASLWNDTRMGEHWMIEPDTAVRARYDVLFSLTRAMLNGKPPASPKKSPEKKPPDDLPLKESGPVG